MTDILKRLDDRTATLQKAMEQISSRLHEHITACPREGNDEILPVTTPSVAALVDPLLQGPALNNEMQVNAPSPSATPSLPRPIAAVNAKYRMAGNFGEKIFWRIAEIMTFGGIDFGN